MMRAPGSGLTRFSHAWHQSYEHENLHMTFKDNYELFAAENESRNIDAREHALGTREEIQVCRSCYTQGKICMLRWPQGAVRFCDLSPKP